MKKMIYLFVLTASLFANEAFALDSYICQNHDQLMELEAGPVREEVDSYDECNGGVGDEMTGCVPHYFKTLVRDATMKVRVKDSYIVKSIKLKEYRYEFSVFDIITYDDIELYIDIHFSEVNPFVNIRVMRRQASGNSIEIGNHTINCDQKN